MPALLRRYLETRRAIIPHTRPKLPNSLHKIPINTPLLIPLRLQVPLPHVQTRQRPLFWLTATRDGQLRTSLSV